MEYGTEIDCSEYMIDQNYNRYIGWNSEAEDCIQDFYSSDTVKLISTKVSELLRGVDPQNRKIVVPNQTIINVMDGIQTSYRPQTGDIYGRYNVPNTPIDNIKEMIDQTIELITTDVRNNLEIDENNRKLTVWTTVLGDFNEHGLKQHPPIKIRNKRPTPMQFNMNY